MFFGIFNIFPNLLTTGLTTLFPIFASYKALRTGDPQQLTPWLMFWVCFTIAQTAEYWFSWAVDWVPFYAWIRFGAYLYLVQGAPYLYQTHVHPFLAQHEQDIERFISEAHENGRRVGLQYLNQAIEYVKVNILGMAPQPARPPPAHPGQGGSGSTYAQNLLSRFNLPSATQGLAAPAGDFYGLVSGALQGAAQWQRQQQGGASSRDAAAGLSATGALIPEEIARGRPEERARYIASQRDRLQTLISAYDNEAAAHASASRDPSRERSGLTKSRSELDFDRVEYDEALEGGSSGHNTPSRLGAHRTTSGGWMPWQWGGAQQQQEKGRLSPQPPSSRSRTPSREDRGRATSNDLVY